MERTTQTRIKRSMQVQVQCTSEAALPTPLALLCRSPWEDTIHATARHLSWCSLLDTCNSTALVLVLVFTVSVPQPKRNHQDSSSTTHSGVRVPLDSATPKALRQAPDALPLRRDITLNDLSQERLDLVELIDFSVLEEHLALPRQSVPQHNQSRATTAKLATPGHTSAHNTHGNVCTRTSPLNTNMRGSCSGKMLNCATNLSHFLPSKVQKWNASRTFWGSGETLARASLRTFFTNGFVLLEAGSTTAMACKQPSVCQSDMDATGPKEQHTLQEPAHMCITEEVD